VKTAQSRQRRYEHLSEAELQAVEAEAKRTRYGLRDHLAVRMAYRHGLRASELVAIEWTDLDLAAGRFLVRRAKGGVSTTHHLDGDVIRALRKIQRLQPVGSRFVFLTERGGPWSAPGFSRMVERVGDRALPDRGVHAHMLRHSCGHHLAAKGVDTRRIQDYLGHAAITSTQVYTRLQAVHLRGIWR
jgi:type 1 fimbriae regulatory protein FimB/type 1 fimbriae regulatory protein FimE